MTRAERSKPMRLQTKKFMEHDPEQLQFLQGELAVNLLLRASSVAIKFYAILVNLQIF